MLRTLRLGLLSFAIICLGMHNLPAMEPASPTNPTYQGKQFDQWLNEFRTELEPAMRRESLAALVVFGRNGKADIVVPLILELLDGYNLRTVAIMPASFDEGSAELQKELNEGKLHEVYHALGFTDVDDLQLYLTADRGLMRLAPRAVPLLVKHVETEGRPSASRVAAMRTLSMEAHEEWLRLVPQLVARDGLTAELAMQFFMKIDFLVDISNYEECLRNLLTEKSSRNHVAIVNALLSNSDKIPRLRKPIRSILQDLQKKSSDEKVQVAIKQALDRIARDPDESRVVPVSVEEKSKP